LDCLGGSIPLFGAWKSTSMMYVVRCDAMYSIVSLIGSAIWYHAMYYALSSDIFCWIPRSKC
jgi:hypothetical protein